MKDGDMRLNENNPIRVFIEESIKMDKDKYISDNNLLAIEVLSDFQELLEKKRNEVKGNLTDKEMVLLLKETIDDLKSKLSEPLSDVEKEKVEKSIELLSGYLNDVSEVIKQTLGLLKTIESLDKLVSDILK